MYSFSTLSLFNCLVIFSFVAVFFLFQTIESAVLSGSPKIPLFQACQSNNQCAAEHSFCGWTEENDLTAVCMCRDGFRAAPGSSVCTPIHQWCEFADFNDGMRAGGGCPQNDKQFCRRNVCLCRPNYNFDDAGNCVLDRLAVAEGLINGTIPVNVYLTDDDSPGFHKFLSDPAAPQLIAENPEILVRYHQDPYNRILERIEAKNSAAILMITLLGFLIITVILMTVSMIFAVVYYRKYHQLKSRKAYQAVEQQIA